MVVIGLYSLILTVAYIRTQDERWIKMVRRSPLALAASPLPLRGLFPTGRFVASARVPHAST